MTVLQKTKQILLSALAKVLTPIIHMMLRNGVSYQEFIGLTKQLYVNVAAREFGIDGRQTNTSRVSLLTGIDRKEVKRLKDLQDGDRELSLQLGQQDRISRLLSAWHQDAEFLNEYGLPRMLPVEGEARSFASLARRFGGNIQMTTLHKEFIRSKLVEVQEDGRLRVLQRDYFPPDIDFAPLVRASTVLSDLGDTFMHNLYLAENKKVPRRFERRASNINIAPEHLPAFHRFIEAEGQAFLERIDAWMSQNELSKTNDEPLPQKHAKRIGVSVFAFETDIKTNSDNDD